MKKQIASLAVILLAVSSLAFYGCGDAEIIHDDETAEPPGGSLEPTGGELEDQKAAGEGAPAVEEEK